MKKWESKTPRKHQEWDDREILEFGSDTITLGEFTNAKYTHFAAVSGLKKAIERSETISEFKARGLKDLARRADPETILAVRSVGTEKLCAFMVALDIVGGNSDKWYNSDDKLTTRQRRAKPQKKSRVRPPKRKR